MNSGRQRLTSTSEFSRASMSYVKDSEILDGSICHPSLYAVIKSVPSIQIAICPLLSALIHIQQP